MTWLTVEMVSVSLSLLCVSGTYQSSYEHETKKNLLHKNSMHDNTRTTELTCILLYQNRLIASSILKKILRTGDVCEDDSLLLYCVVYTHTFETSTNFNGKIQRHAVERCSLHNDHREELNAQVYLNLSN